MTSRGWRAGAGPDRGQSTVELALALPLVAMLAALIVQVGVVVFDQVLVVHAAREAARRAAVSPADDTSRVAAQRAGPLDARRLDIRIDRDFAAGTVMAAVSYRAATDVPLVGALLPDVALSARVVMSRE